MDIKNKGFLSIEQIQDQYLNQKKTVNKPATDVSFEDILKAKTLDASKPQDLRFSKHASMRLTDRNISLSQDQLKRLNDATVKAGEKGIKESLVLMDTLAFVVNIPNNTVITALDKSEANLNVFTNIDGAVII